ERYAQVAAVEIGIGVEEVRFEARLGAADGRAQPDIGDAVDRAAAERVVGAVAADPHRVDAESRPQILAEPEIGGREADRAAAPVAFHDPPVDLPEAAELGGGIARPAVAQQLADAGRGIDRRVRPVYRLDDGQAEA